MNTPYAKRAARAVGLFLLAATFAACGGDDGGSPSDVDQSTGADAALDATTTSADATSSTADLTLDGADDGGMDSGTASDVDDVPEDASAPSDTAASDASDATDAMDEVVAPSGMPVIAGVGWQGLLVLSIDEGQTWCQVDLMDDGHDDLYRGGTWADGRFVGAHAGLNNRGSIRVSEDGHTWVSRHATNREPDLLENPMRQWYGGAAYGNGVWLAAGGCGKIARSTDGTETWTDLGRFSDTCLHIRSMVFHDGQFVFGADDDNWYASPNGEDLTLLEAGAGSRVTVVDGQLSGPIDGRTWSQGRGVCLAGGGSPNFRIFRSTEPGCANATEVADTPANVTTFLFGVVDEARYTRDALGAELADCLGVQ